jgi:hypothetical protein
MRPSATVSSRSSQTQPQTVHATSVKVCDSTGGVFGVKRHFPGGRRTAGWFCLMGFSTGGATGGR